MKTNPFYYFIQSAKCPHGYTLVQKKNFILIEPQDSNNKKPHIRVDAEFDNNYDYLSMAHYTETLSIGATVRVYFTNHGKIRNIKATRNDSAVELSHKALHEVRTNSLIHYDATLGYYYSSIESIENKVRSKIATSSKSEFEAKINKLIKMNPRNIKLYKMWTNINNYINNPPETKPIENTLDKLKIHAEDPIVSILEENIEHKESKADPNVEIVSNLKEALSKNLQNNEWNELVVNLDLLLVYGQKIEEFHKKVNEEFAKFDLQVIREMYSIIEPNIDETCFEELFIKLLVTEDKAEESKLLEIFELLNHKSRKFVAFMKDLNKNMTKHYPRFMETRVGKSKEKMAIEIYKNLFKTEEKFEDIEITEENVKASEKYPAGKKELFDILHAIIKNEEIASMSVPIELFDHLETYDTLFYIFAELHVYHKIYSYVAYAALYGKTNLFKALTNSYDYFICSSFDPTSNSVNALGACLMFLGNNPNRDLELSQYLQIFMDKGYKPTILSGAKHYREEQKKLLFDRVRNIRSNVHYYEVTMYGCSVLDYVYQKPFSLETILPYDNDLPKLIYCFSRLTMCPGIYMTFSEIVDTSLNYQDVFIDVNLKYRKNTKYVYSGRNTNKIIELTSDSQKNDSLMSCIDLILGQIYQLIAASSEATCHKYIDIIEKDTKANETQKLLAQSYFNALLYYLGKIDKQEYKSQLEKLKKLQACSEHCACFNCYVSDLKINDITEKVNYMQLIHTYYKPKFKSFLKPDLYCMVAYNDKEMVVMSFNKYINKEQLLFNVNKLKDRRICICHTGEFDEELNQYLTKELLSISFEVCPYYLAEVCFSFARNKLSVTFDITSHAKLNMEYDENDYQMFYGEYQRFYKVHSIPFMYGAMDETKLLSLVEKNDVEGVKAFFRNTFVYPIDAFMASYRKLLRHSLQKEFKPEEYSQTEADKSIVIFYTLSSYGGNKFHRFDLKGRVTEYVAVCIYNKMFSSFSKKRITSVKDMVLPSKHGYIDVFSRKLLKFLQAVKTKASINIIFNDSEASRIISSCERLTSDLFSAFSDLKDDIQSSGTNQSKLQVSDIGLRTSELEKIDKVLRNDDFTIHIPW